MKMNPMQNPVYKREVRVSARSFRFPMIMMIVNSILAMVALLNMYSTLAQVRLTAEIQYSSFLDLYVFLAVLEFVMLLIIMPAMTAGSISSEKEHQTLDLLLTTRMTPFRIVMGKLFSVLSMVLLLVVSSFPIFAIVFVYGGITMQDIAQMMLCYLASSLLMGGIGIFCSSLFKRTSAATLAAYGILGVLAGGSWLVNQLMTYQSLFGGQTALGSSGRFLYLLLANPVTTFICTVLRLTAEDATASDMSKWFGSRPTNFVLTNWISFSIALQFLAGLCFIAGAVYVLGKRRHIR